MLRSWRAMYLSSKCTSLSCRTVRKVFSATGQVPRNYYLRIQSCVWKTEIHNGIGVMTKWYMQNGIGVRTRWYMQNGISINLRLLQKLEIWFQDSWYPIFKGSDFWKIHEIFLKWLFCGGCYYFGRYFGLSLRKIIFYYYVLSTKFNICNWLLYKKKIFP